MLGCNLYEAFYMKQLYYVLLLVFMTSMQAAPHKPLSVVEAIDIIWTMNYKDVRELRETVFPELSNKKEEAVSKATTKMEKIRKFIADHIWGETLVDRVLQTFLSATPKEQELMKQEIKASYDEYTGGVGILGLLAAIITFPIGFPMLMGYQMGYEKAIEVQRAKFAGLGILNREIS